MTANIVTYPNLRAEMARHGMTANDLAEYLYLSRSTVAGYISRGGWPTETKQEVCRLFDRTDKYLFNPAVAPRGRPLGRALIV